MSQVNHKVCDKCGEPSTRGNTFRPMWQVELQDHESRGPHRDATLMSDWGDSLNVDDEPFRRLDFCAECYGKLIAVIAGFLKGAGS